MFRLIPLLSLAACAPVSGVWMVTFPYDDGAITCETSIAENYVDGYVPEGDTGTTTGDWQYSEEYVGSDALSFFQIETTAGGDAVLLVGSAAYPGEKVDGNWLFEWTTDESSTATATHETGYAYSETYTATSKSRFTIDRQGLFGGTAEGKLLYQDLTTVGWRESDTWEEELMFEIGDEGQTPVDLYLVYEDGGDEYAQVNDWETEDCTAADCELTVTEDCRGEGSFTAVRTHYGHEETWSYLQGSGN